MPGLPYNIITGLGTQLLKFTPKTVVMNKLKTPLLIAWIVLLLSSFLWALATSNATPPEKILICHRGSTELVAK